VGKYIKYKRSRTTLLTFTRQFQIRLPPSKLCLTIFECLPFVMFLTILAAIFHLLQLRQIYSCRSSFNRYLMKTLINNIIRPRNILYKLNTSHYVFPIKMQPYQYILLTNVLLNYYILSHMLIENNFKRYI
jgi:hypothetical protein